ncbi:gamma-glutamyl-gamma-aminobutyrate hydrolase family protein [Actinokineospora sp. HUAS TT18]|uniref:gamma-glutamyl-gamma-aminobutyrate hydrolase family protein n=1 Tax=Actinokineospora sp. HUAS TT18 TaxID=3447451 RepID=UPI003F51F2DE
MGPRAHRRRHRNGLAPARDLPGDTAAQRRPRWHLAPALGRAPGRSRGLRDAPGGLVVSALAADGTVEAVELSGRPWVLGVQWHPEMGSDPRVVHGLMAAAGMR